MNLGQLTTEGRNPATTEIDRLSAREIVLLMNREDSLVPAAVGKVAEAIATAIEIITDRLRAGGRLIYLGAGTSGRLGVLDASECPPTFNSPPWQVVGVIAGGLPALTRAVEGAEDHPEQAVADLRRLGLCAGDVLVGIATSGRTPYVLGGLKYAREMGAYAIGLACNADSELASVAHLVIAPIVGPEVISGSTRLKAGTATKLILNMLTTGSMVRLGKTYGNLMVDLQTTNQKLTDRARRIVATLTGLSQAEAAEWLVRSDGDVKTAIVMQQRQLDLGEARRLLDHVQGRLREALVAEVPPPVAHDQAAWVLGVDGGGTKTVAWLAEANSLEVSPRGLGEAGPGNPQSVGWTAALANIDRAIGLAFQAAGIPRQRVAAICLALAGAGRPADQERVKNWARPRGLADRVLVVPDALPLLAAGTRTGSGIALVAGTGSVAYGSDGRGQLVRAGGWGYLFDDAGSAYDLVRQALQAVARAVDGRGPATRLVTDVLQALQLSTPEELVPFIYARADDRQWLASLAPVVLAAGKSGDAVACQLIDQAVEQLIELVTVVRSRFSEPVHDLALGGGLLVHNEHLRARLLERLRTIWPELHHVGLVPQPVAGAVVLARGALTTAGACP